MHTHAHTWMLESWVEIGGELLQEARHFVREVIGGNGAQTLQDLRTREIVGNQQCLQQPISDGILVCRHPQK